MLALFANMVVSDKFKLFRGFTVVIFLLFSGHAFSEESLVRTTENHSNKRGKKGYQQIVPMPQAEYRCPAGYDLVGTQCMNTEYLPLELDCPMGTELSNGRCVSFCDPVTQCPDGYIGGGQNCVRVVYVSPIEQMIYEAPQAICPKGYKPTGSFKEDEQCYSEVAAISTCPAGFVSSKHHCVRSIPAQVACPPGTQLTIDKKLQKCLQTLIGNPMCPGDFVDNGAGQCERAAFSQWAPCPDGFSPSGVEGERCSKMEKWDADPSCPPDSEMVGNMCRTVIPVQPFCPPGFDQTQAGCFKRAPQLLECPQGCERIQSGGGVVCRKSTYEPMVPVCPLNFELAGNQCKTVQIGQPSFSCPSGFVSDGDRCVSRRALRTKLSCPSGYNLVAFVVRNGQRYTEAYDVGRHADPSQSVETKCLKVYQTDCSITTYEEYCEPAPTYAPKSKSYGSADYISNPPKSKGYGSADAYDVSDMDLSALMPAPVRYLGEQLPHEEKKNGGEDEAEPDSQDEDDLDQGMEGLGSKGGKMLADKGKDRVKMKKSKASGFYYPAPVPAPLKYETVVAPAPAYRPAVQCQKKPVVIPKTCDKEEVIDPTVSCPDGSQYVQNSYEAQCIIEDTCEKIPSCRPGEQLDPSGSCIRVVTAPIQYQCPSGTQRCPTGQKRCVIEEDVQPTARCPIGYPETNIEAGMCVAVADPIVPPPRVTSSRLQYSCSSGVLRGDTCVEVLSSPRERMCPDGSFPRSSGMMVVDVRGGGKKNKGSKGGKYMQADCVQVVDPVAGDPIYQTINPDLVCPPGMSLSKKQDCVEETLARDYFCPAGSIEVTQGVDSPVVIDPKHSFELLGTMGPVCIQLTCFAEAKKSKNKGNVEYVCPAGYTPSYDGKKRKKMDCVGKDFASPVAACPSGFSPCNLPGYVGKCVKYTDPAARCPSDCERSLEGCVRRTIVTATVSYVSTPNSYGQAPTYAATYSGYEASSKGSLRPSVETTR